MKKISLNSYIPRALVKDRNHQFQSSDPISDAVKLYNIYILLNVYTVQYTL